MKRRRRKPAVSSAVSDGRLRGGPFSGALPAGVLHQVIVGGVGGSQCRRGAYDPNAVSYPRSGGRQDDGHSLARVSGNRTTGGAPEKVFRTSVALRGGKL